MVVTLSKVENDVDEGNYRFILFLEQPSILLKCLWYYLRLGPTIVENDVDGVLEEIIKLDYFQNNH